MQFNAFLNHFLSLSWLYLIWSQRRLGEVIHFDFPNFVSKPAKSLSTTAAGFTASQVLDEIREKAFTGGLHLCSYRECSYSFRGERSFSKGKNFEYISPHSLPGLAHWSCRKWQMAPERQIMWLHRDHTWLLHLPLREAVCVQLLFLYCQDFWSITWSHWLEHLLTITAPEPILQTELN